MKLSYETDDGQWEEAGNNIQPMDMTPLTCCQASQLVTRLFTETPHTEIEEFEICGDCYHSLRNHLPHIPEILTESSDRFTFKFTPPTRDQEATWHTSSS